MPACRQGHDSADPDWCDVCGLALGPAAPTPAPTPPPDCPACGAALAGRFCERCGHDSAGHDSAGHDSAGHDSAGPAVVGPPPAPARPVTWQAVVRADPAWFDVVRRQNGASLDFPRYAPERRFVLSGEQLTIGRRSRTRGTAPDIDLADVDPAVSAAHALLVARPGGWDLVDLDSTNGTTLAVDDGPIPPHVPVPLPDGAVIRLGAWTTITVTAG